MLNKHKIKFQNQDFKKKLVVARTYKRSSKQIPEKPFGIFLGYLGIYSLKLKILIFFLLLSLIYLFLVPNFFSVKHITVSGLNNPSNLSEIKTCIKQTMHWPKNNLILLSNNKLINSLEKNCPTISQVKSLEKDYPNTLNFTIKERFEQFLVHNQSGQYVLSNDGVFLKQLSQTDIELNATATNQLLPFYLINNPEEYYVNQALATPDTFERLEAMLVEFKEKLLNPIKQITLLDKTFTNAEMITQTGYQVKLNLNLVNEEFLQNLEDLLNDITSSRINSVKYIDLRVEKKAYVCYKDAICAKNLNTNSLESN
jgi:cell division septal protein FtsQ